MAKTIISDDCISCGGCAGECPNEAIFEGADHYEVNADKCTECAERGGDRACVAVCPVGACAEGE